MKIQSDALKAAKEAGIDIDTNNEYADDYGVSSKEKAEYDEKIYKIKNAYNPETGVLDLTQLRKYI